MVNFSVPQKHAAEYILQFVQQPDKFAKELLLWAVPGAGKTETIFPALHYAIRMQKHILFATPRKDVVLELTPRLQQAFPYIGLISLHGDSRQKGEIGPFVVSTVNQVINYYRYFDLVVLDEVDAYPFQNNPMFQHVVKQACHPSAQMIYLTATPPNALIDRAKRKQVELVTIPVRYHGYPLVEPRIMIERQLSKSIKRQKLSPTIWKFVEHVTSHNRRGLIFVPNIDWIAPIVHMILPLQFMKDNGSFQWVEGTYADDPERMEKVSAFRNGDIQMLVTTTILERGVNVPFTDCLVVGADAPIFNTSTLIQMAGRVGRSKDDANGLIWFLGEGRSRGMMEATAYFRKMNRKALALGYLQRSQVNKPFSICSSMRDFIKRTKKI